MLWPFTLALLVGLFVSGRTRGPMWAFTIAWLITVAPLTFDLITFNALKDYRWQTTNLLLVAFLAFAIGIAVATVTENLRKTARVERVTYRDGQCFAAFLPYAFLLLGIGLSASLLYFVDYYLSGFADTSSLAELRENVTTRDSATPFGQVSQLLAWANPVVFFFALFYRRRLTRTRLLLLLSAGLLHLVPALLSAGRQTVFQMMILTILALAMDRKITPPAKRERSIVLQAGIVGSTAAYMLYMAVARSEVWETRSKETILMALFDFRVSDWLDGILDLFPSAFRSSLVEGLVYFSHTPALFDSFLQLDQGIRFWGANTFPFLMRRVSGLTGIHPDVAYQYKVELLNSVQLIGTGWSTAYSGLVLDFGYAGLYAALAVLGFLSQLVWNGLRTETPFPVAMLGALLLLTIVYLPTSIAVSDTNIFFAFAACLVACIFRIGFPKVRGPENISRAKVVTA